MTPSRAPRALWFAVALAAFAALANFMLIGRIELTFDEAYYTLWSRSLAWGYYDHPPMIAFWIRASTALFGGTEFGVRALGALIYALAPALVFMTAARLARSLEAGAFAALAWLATPLVAGAALATPDAPLTFFSLCALAGLVEVYRGQRLGWAILGVALGLALLSKFTALFLVAGVALAIAATPSLRFWAKRPEPYLAAFAAAAISAPFLYWNAEHGWATFAKQFGRVPAHGFAPRYLFEFIGAQALIANPLLLAVAVWGAAWTRSETRRLLFVFIAPALAYFFVHSLHDRVQGNWTAPLFPAFAVLVGTVWAQGPAPLRRLAAAGIVLGALAIAAIEFHVLTDWPALGPVDPIARIGGWRDLTREVDEAARNAGARFIVARGYAATSLLTYYGDAGLPVRQADDPERWIFAAPPEAAAFDGPGLAIGEAGRGLGFELQSEFGEIEPLGAVSRRRGGAAVDAYELFRVGKRKPGALSLP